MKKLFYALRPAAALRWLRMRPEQAVAPMSFLTLMAEAEVPAEVRGQVDALVAAKARTREMGMAPAPPALLAFMAAEFDAASGWAEAGGGAPVAEAARAEAVALYRWAVERVSGA